jgi:hypothetical protein
MHREIFFPDRIPVDVEELTKSDIEDQSRQGRREWAGARRFRRRDRVTDGFARAGRHLSNGYSTFDPAAWAMGLPKCGRQPGNCANLFDLDRWFEGMRPYAKDLSGGK